MWYACTDGWGHSAEHQQRARGADGAGDFSSAVTYPGRCGRGGPHSSGGEAEAGCRAPDVESEICVPRYAVTPRGTSDQLPATWPPHYIALCCVATWIARCKCSVVGVGLTRVCHSMLLLLLHQVAAARATMAARRDARARNSVTLAGGPRAALATPPTSTGTEADGGVDSPPAATTAAFGRRSAAAAAAAVPMHPSGASTERSHRAAAAAERRRDAGQQQGQVTMSARAGRRAAAAPVGGGPGLMAVRATCMADRTEKTRNLSHNRCCSPPLTLHSINTNLFCCAVCGTRPCDNHRGLRRQQRYGLSPATSCVRLQCVRRFLSWH